MSGYARRNRPLPNGSGPNGGVQRSYATHLKESEPLFNSYEHLQGLPRGDAALTLLRRIASLVKPIMRKRGWRVQILAEFLPPEQNLLGLNVNKGYKICLRLRYHHHPDLFLPAEEIVDTMLHELSHNVWGEHDGNFHRLWDELRDEHEVLVRKGYTGEGFLSEGHRFGGGSSAGRSGPTPPHEMRRLARASAEKRKAQGMLNQGSGRRLGGAPLHAQSGADVRRVIAEQVMRRNAMIDRGGCASGRSDAGKLSDQAANHTFKTQADEDDANDRAIAQALYELMEEEEERKLQGTFAEAPFEGGGGLAWRPESGLYDAGNQSVPSPSTYASHPSEEEQMKWAMQDSTVSPASVSNPTNNPPFSPVSPMLPEHPNRTASAPPLDGKPNGSRSAQNPPQLNGKPLSRLINDDATSTKRKRSAAPPTPSPSIDISEPHNTAQWTCQICTCINPMRFLACDACGVERPQQPSVGSNVRHARSLDAAGVSRDTNTPRWTIPKPAQTERLGWNCGRCGAFMEHKWWTCSACGVMKNSS